MEFSNDFFDHERDNKQFLSYEAQHRVQTSEIFILWRMEPSALGSGTLQKGGAGTALWMGTSVSPAPRPLWPGVRGVRPRRGERRREDTCVSGAGRAQGRRSLSSCLQGVGALGQGVWWGGVRGQEGE